MRVGVIGASGYAGGELLRLLAAHPEFEPTYLAAGSNAGESVTSVHTHLTNYEGVTFENVDLARMSKVDLVFLALPHGQSAPIARELPTTAKVVDLGADFRLSSEVAWQKYYGGEYAGSWVYGLPELPGQRLSIKGTNRIANPGCYATAIALGIAPAIAAGAIDASDIVVVAASGTTGAGRNGKVALSASEIMNSLSSYKFGGVHQHTPEIEETLSNLSATPVKVSFTPILAPMPRGILATITARSATGHDELRKIYEAAYSAERFVKLLPEGRLPETASLIASNGAHLQIAKDEHTARLVVSIAIDNLGKGAAGQAIQNANLISGLAEDAGLTELGIGQ